MMNAILIGQGREPIWWMLS